MRIVIIATRDDNVQTLARALTEEGFEPTSSQRIGAGAALAEGITDDIVAAVAVIPPSSAGLSAVLVEVGIALGRGLPLLVMVTPGSELPPALLGVRSVVADVDNREALGFQLRMFAQSLRTDSAQPEPTSPAGKPLSSHEVARFRGRLAEMARGDTPGKRGAAFEKWIVDVLRAGGATVEQDRRYAVDQGVDAVASIPGEEHLLGPLLVQAKFFSGSPHLQVPARKLVGQVLTRGAGLGLLIYGSPSPDPKPDRTPRVISLWAEDLIVELEQMSLAEVLVRARNEAIHRL
ncbi:MAG: restriction endonuclease [Solirubrobacteraceae bacterium]